MARAAYAMYPLLITCTTIHLMNVDAREHAERIYVDTVLRRTCVPIQSGRMRMQIRDACAAKVQFSAGEEVKVSHGATYRRDENNEIVIRTVRGPEINEAASSSHCTPCPMHSTVFFHFSFANFFLLLFFW